MKTRSVAFHEPTVFHQLGDRYPRLTTPSKLRNYSMKDPIGDVFDKWMKKPPTEFTEFIMEQGNRFETFVKNYMHDICKTNGLRMHSFKYKPIHFDTMDDVLRVMKLGTDVLYNVPVIDPETGTKGIIDFLIRTDRIHYFFDITEDHFTTEELERPSTLGPFHYTVFDTKYTTGSLCSDGVHLNNDHSQRFMKLQLYIYSTILRILQGFVPNKAVIVCRKLSFTKKGIPIKRTHLRTTIGMVNIHQERDEMSQLYKYGRRWLNFVQKCSIDELERTIPNTTVSSQYDNDKQKLVEQHRYVNGVSYCSVIHQCILEQHGIRNYLDERCTAELMGIPPSKVSIVNSILEFQRQDTQTVSGLEHIHLPPNEDIVIMDFEVLSSVFLDDISSLNCSAETLVFLIGIRTLVDSQWCYIPFLMNQLCYEEEREIFTKCAQFLAERPRTIVVHWSRAERTWWDMLCRRYGVENTLVFYDLHETFEETPVLIKGVTNNKLKPVVNKLYEHGLIRTNYTDSSITDGNQCSLEAFKYYTQHRNPSVINSIVRYNDIDCQVLQEIVECIRTKQ